MHVVFTILKVLLWILLIILGLILLLILLLLFCPFRYRLAGEKTEECLWARIKVGWFIVGISGKYDKPSGLDLSARILGIRVVHRKMFEPKPVAEAELISENGVIDPQLLTGENPAPVDASSGAMDKPPESPEEPVDKKADKKAEKERKAAEKAAKKAEKKAEKEAAKEEAKTDNVPAGDAASAENAATEEVVTLPDKVMGKIDDAQTKADIILDKIYQKADQLNTKKRHVFQFLEKPYTKKTLKRIKKIIKRLFGTIKPKKSRAWLHIGMKSAADTGELLGKVSRFYNLYGRWLTIEPDFYYKVMEGNFDIRGRIYLFRFLFPAIGLILSPSTWKTLKMAKKI